MISTDTIATLVDLAIDEDIGSGDITAALLPSEQVVQAKIITREPMILCGRDFAAAVFSAIDPTINVQWLLADGDGAAAGATLCHLSGNSAALLTAERAALNFLQMLSGTATTVSHYVAAIEGTNAKLLDTRKTIPGFRLAQKYAVTCGGGMNHRVGLYDAYLIKENHIAACGSITSAVTMAKSHHPDTTVEVEVESLDECQQALSAGADIIMLDNFAIEAVVEAVQLAGGRAKIEVSGNVSLETIREIALAGVDYISVGALTKHIQAVDLSMRVQD